MTCLAALMPTWLALGLIVLFAAVALVAIGGIIYEVTLAIRDWWNG